MFLLTGNRPARLEGPDRGETAGDDIEGVRPDAQDEAQEKSWEGVNHNLNSFSRAILLSKARLTRRYLPTSRTGM